MEKKNDSSFYDSFDFSASGSYYLNFLKNTEFYKILHGIDGLKSGIWNDLYQLERELSHKGEIVDSIKKKVINLEDKLEEYWGEYSQLMKFLRINAIYFQKCYDALKNKEGIVAEEFYLYGQPYKADDDHWKITILVEKIKNVTIDAVTHYINIQTEKYYIDYVCSVSSVSNTPSFDYLIVNGVKSAREYEGYGANPMYTFKFNINDNTLPNFIKNIVKDIANGNDVSEYRE